MQKVVVKLLDFDLNDEDCKQRSIKAVSAQFFTGDVTIYTDAEENTLTVIGRRVVPQVIVDRLTKYVCQAEVVSVETVEETKPKKFQFADPIGLEAADRVNKLFDTIRHSNKTEPKLDPRFKTTQGSTFIKPAGFGQYGKFDKQGGFAQNFNPPGLPPAGFAQNFKPPGLPEGFAEQKHQGFAQLAERYNNKPPEFIDQHKNPYVGLQRNTSTSAGTSRSWSTTSGTGTGSSTGGGTSRSFSTFSAASTGTNRGSSTTSDASRGTSRIPGNGRDSRTTTEISRQEKKEKEKK
ncbi:hypothetical protein MKW92_001961 [Papaver armeniacum]|nr:hypothetical protein MKW92_001961 [Papaver armeniacum]